MKLRGGMFRDLTTMASDFSTIYLRRGTLAYPQCTITSPPPTPSSSL